MPPPPPTQRTPSSESRGPHLRRESAQDSTWPTLGTLAGPSARAGAVTTDPTPVLSSPPPAVHAEKLFRRIDDIFAWLDGWIARWLPAEFNPLAQAGAAANFALLVAVATGVLLLIWYSPSLQFAYASLAAIQGHTLGGWVRATHRYSSDLAMLLLLVHAARMLFARKFAGARWLAWVSGAGLIALVWFIGWTGYWLVWDQPAQHVAITSIRLLDGLPIFGEPLGRLFVADRTVPSLLFFVVFFLHMLLPLAIAVGLAVHLARVSRARLLPRRPLMLALLVGMVIAAALVPAPLDAPAAMAAKVPALTADTWYLAPLALALRLQNAGLWLALGTGLLVSALLPWLLGRRRAPDTFQAVVAPARCHACTQCVQDCPFDAISMVARTDGKAFPSQAYVDPARCVGCGVCAGSCDSEGIALTWFDTRVQEARLEREIETDIATRGATWIAFIAAEIRAPLPELDGFVSHRVPTASWVRPKFLERLFARGVKGALVVRDARAEAWARDGGRWIAARLSGERKPVLRPERAGEGTWLVADFDPSHPAALAKLAARFRAGDVNGLHRPRPRPIVLGLTWVAVIALVLAATIAPSHLRVANPVSPEPELVISFRAYGERVAAAPLDPAVEAAKPIHMRGRATEKPHRADVVLRVAIDGVTEERAFAAKGISRDGPAIGEWRVALAPGAHTVAIELATEKASLERWTQTLEAEPRRLHVITYEPGTGFRLEP